MGKTCGACRKFLSPVGAAICSVCPNLFHKGCLALPESSTASKDWVCPFCKKNQRKGDNSCTPVKGVSGTDLTASGTCASGSAVGSPLTEVAPVIVQTPHTPLTPLIATSSLAVSDLALCDGMRRELAEYMAELRLYRMEMVEFRTEMSAINERMGSFERRLEAIEQREIPPATNDVAELEKTVFQLKSELNDRDQEALSSDLDIGQLPETKGENVVHAVSVLAAKLGVPLEDRDIVFAERVGSAGRTGSDGTEGRTRRIIVRLARRHLRDDLLIAARVRRTLTTADLGLGAPQQRIYINERLTHHNRQLFHRVREECRKLNWRYSWTKRGRVHARQADGKQAFPFRSEADVARVFQTGTV